ncbi:MAG: DMT family transporter, partial [Pseudomonadota bacterium]
IAMAGFAVSDGFLKELTETIPAGQLLVIFGVLGGGLLALVSLLRGAPLYGPWLFQPLFLARLLTDMLAAAGVVSAFALAPLSLVSAIMQVSPLIAALAAVWLLGEKLGLRRLSAIGVGLFGVLLIVEPWGAQIEGGALLAAFGATMLALRDVLTRKMPGNIPSEALVTYGFLAIAPGGLLALAVSPGWVAVSLPSLALIIGGVLTGIFGYTMITLASRIAEISAIAPFRYSRLVFALLIGGFFFGERLAPIAILGSVLVIGSGLFVFWRESRLRSKAA